MLFAQVVVALAVTIGVRATPYARNIAYHSPFESRPHLGYDTDVLERRHVKRQTTSSAPFKDEHYVLYAGADFRNAPFVWAGGVNFTHGVASGDPLSTSVLLWTRGAPAGSAQPDQSVPICVSYSVWDNANKSGAPVDSGDAFTSVDVDWTVKVEATNLKPDTWYWYQFADCTNAKMTSVLGRTRTFASPDIPAEQVNGGKSLKLAVLSCANFPFGFFNAYRVATENVSVDAFIHLGDYYYEYADRQYGDGHAIGRVLSDRELGTQADYRTRIALYRTDRALLSAHASAPWITVWDDHEVADNTWKAGSTNSNDSVPTNGCAFSPSGTCFSDRKSNGVRAYHEWMPIRQVAADDKLRIWRNFRIGKLLDLTMLDTRQYDRDVTDNTWNHNLVNSLVDNEQRSIMGAAQEEWFFDRLLKSQQRGAVWRIVGQQVVFAKILYGVAFNLDAWDGYRASRTRVLKYLVDNKINNVVLLSGDSHANWVSDLSLDDSAYNSITGEGALGVEFAGTAVSSPSPFGEHILPAAADILSAGLVAINKDLQWSEGAYRGFFVLDVSPTQLESTFYALAPADLQTENTKGFISAKFSVLPGENMLKRPVAGGKVAAGALKFLGL